MIITSPAIEVFRTIPDKISAVHRALADPAVVEALNLIELANKPTDSTVLPSVQGLHPDQAVSRKYHTMLGVATAIATLRALATPPPVKPDRKTPADLDFASGVDPSLLDEPTLP